MTSRQRVRAALEHRQPDRVPIDFGGPVTSFTYGAYRRVAAYFGITEPKARIGGFKVMDDIDEEILVALKSDCRYVLFSPRGPRWGNTPNGDGTFRDFWGITFRDVGDYYEMIQNPLREYSLEELENHAWPDFDDDEAYEGLAERARDLYENTGYAVVGNCAINLLERSQWLRGLDVFLADMLADEAFTNAILDKMLELGKTYLDHYLAAVGEYLDVICLGDDLGTQSSLLFSPQLYRSMVKPRYTELCSYIKARTRAKIWHHSCGAVYPLVGDLIDAGVDILNPVQPRAAGMDRRKLKAEFGDRLSFWGGVDIQHVLPYGSRQEVVDEVREAVSALGKAGGYVMGPAHNVQSDVDPANLELMVETAIGMKE